jgi:5-amino-6-(5-phosphoribosylamino)uracil reductase/diaminohydroxyphosphoribosylaminopyrimidine deaminase/5-amino-6-(5-phosphoribosylamino)uracil reductase
MGPRVTLHFTQSLDGRIGLGLERERALLSSEEGLVRAHRARSQHDAVLVGVETLLHDDPLLTARGTGDAQPLRVVLDSSLRTPVTARLFGAGKASGAALIIACAERASVERRRELEQAGAQVLLTSTARDGRVALIEALELLHGRGVRSLLVEGGARILTAFLQQRLAARAEVEVAPLWLGEPGTAALGELSVKSMAQALRLDHVELERLGQSVLMRGDVVYPGAAP